MNFQRKPIPAAVPLRSTAPASPSPVGVGPTIIADASKMSPRGFLEALGLASHEMREARRMADRERCIAAIKRGSTYGFPPSLVAECREIIDDQETGWALAERSALR